MTEQEANLRQLAREYWRLRRAHEATTDAYVRGLLDSARLVAHDHLLLAMNDAGIEYNDREHAARIARAWAGEEV